MSHHSHSPITLPKQGGLGWVSSPKQGGPGWVLLLAIVVVAIGLTTLVIYLRASTDDEPVVSCGQLVRYHDFPSNHIQPRTVSVWLPDGYTLGDSCCVMYMHDGKMLFDAATTWNGQEWRVDETFSRMIQADSILPCIVVAIDNTSLRMTEYYPTKTWLYVAPEESAKYDRENILGDNYLRFIVEELKPFIDKQYQPLTDPCHTFIMGSSMGGLISLYAICEYPQVFGGAACLSTHLSMRHLPFADPNVWGKPRTWFEGFSRYLHENLPEPNSCLIYMDHGTRSIDADYGPFQDHIDSLFHELGWNDQHFLSLVFPGNSHKEDHWASRLPYPLHFLLHP